MFFRLSIEYSGLAIITYRYEEQLPAIAARSAFGWIFFTHRQAVYKWKLPQKKRNSNSSKNKFIVGNALFLARLIPSVESIVFLSANRKMELIHSPRDHYLATILLTKSHNDPGLEIGPFPGDAKVSPYRNYWIQDSPFNVFFQLQYSSRETQKMSRIFLKTGATFLLFSFSVSARIFYLTLEQVLMPCGVFRISSLDFTSWIYEKGFFFPWKCFCKGCIRLMIYLYWVIWMDYNFRGRGQHVLQDKKIMLFQFLFQFHCWNEGVKIVFSTFDAASTC